MIPDLKLAKNDYFLKNLAFRSGLPASIAEALADLVRAMNCYYSNLIEGHDTHPIDIERALKADYSKDPRKRDLQLEARTGRSQLELQLAAVPQAPAASVD